MDFNFTVPGNLNLMSRLYCLLFLTQKDLISRQGQEGKLAKIIGHVVAGKLLAQTYIHVCMYTCTGNINFNINLQVSSCMYVVVFILDCTWVFFISSIFIYFFLYNLYFNLFVFDIPVWYPVH